ncbi:prolactin-releasing peptide receptor isoform X3 [Rhipicephalus microplus]|uniref:prolactin-releasing peptide receptor isoform X3 n=1 Tax=Rhipicephalus microplus TaxID=6941 RepID=UPI003F6B4637
MLMPCETSRRPSSTVWNVCSTCIADYGSGFFSAMGNVSHHVDYVSSVPAVRAFFYCVYGLVFAVGVSGNALVCFVVARQRAMHTVTNLFIANLALSDILLCTLAVPFTPLHQFVGAWPLGSALCRMVPYAQGVSVYVSSFTLTAIAVDRFFVIMHPFRGRLRLPVCGALIVLIWVAGALLTLPYGLFIGLTADGGSFCEERWPSEESRRAFSLCTSALQFGVPFTVISFCYMRVCCKLRERARAKPGAKSMQKEQLERRRTRRTNRMLVSMVVIFGACWLPLNLYNLAIDFSLRAASWQFANAFFFLAHAIAVSSTCYNPFLYTWLNDSFRKEFKAVLPCFSSRRAELPPVRYVCSGDAVKL